MEIDASDEPSEETVVVNEPAQDDVIPKASTEVESAFAENTLTNPKDKCPKSPDIFPLHPDRIPGHIDHRTVSWANFLIS